MDIHADESQELTHVFFSEPTNVEAELGQRRKVLEVGRAEARRRLVQVGLQEIRKSRHAFVKCLITLRIAVVYAFDTGP